MSVPTRLHKVTESLSPLQRVVLVLNAIREGRDVDPDIKNVKDPQQRRAFHRLMAFVWVANHHLGVINMVTAHRVEAAEREKYRFLLLNEAADLLDEAEGKPPSKARRNWRSGKGEIEVSVFLRSLALECRDDAAGLVELLWQEVISLEQVWVDLSADFAGEDMVLPERREPMEETARALRDMAKVLGIKKLPDQPDEAIVTGWTEMVNDAIRHLGHVEPF